MTRTRSLFRRAPGLVMALTVAAIMLATMRPASAEIGSYLVYDVESGIVLGKYRPFQPWYPASLTKLMTAYVTFEAMREGRVLPTSPVRVSVHAASQPPSKMGFRKDTVISVDAALKILMTKSANDIAVALAEAVGGTERGFVDEMNATARRLGMYRTNFRNPHGLPNDEQVTTAYDLALLVNALKKDYPEHADLFALSGIRLGKRVYRNHNKLITRYPGTNGMKTGFICASGFNLIASAERDGRELVAIVLGGYTSRERNERTAEYLEMAFRKARQPWVPYTSPELAELEADRSVHVQPVDLRPIVCGPTRPKTPYDDGVAELGDEATEAAEALASAYADPGASMPATAAAEMAALGAMKPVSYLRPPQPVGPPAEIAVGVADPARPNPLSGTVVGGGPPPLPRARPVVLVAVRTGAPIDPVAVVDLADSVRHSVETGELLPVEVASGDGAGPSFARTINGRALPPARPER